MKRNRYVLWRRPKSYLALSALFVFFLTFSCAPLRAEEPVLDGFSINILDAPYFSGLATLLLTKDGQRETLEGWPDMALIWKDGILSLKQGVEEPHKMGAIAQSADGWWPSVSYGDIDFDGKPEFFLLEQEAMKGASYRLVSSKGVFPASLFKAPPSSLIKADAVLFEDGASSEPAFFPKGNYLEFYTPLGPYYTAERWRKNGPSYYLEHQRRAIYSPEIDNAPMAFMEFVRFDEQGDLIGVTYHGARTLPATPLRYTAFLPIPMFSAPSGKATIVANMLAGASFDIVGYDKNDESGVMLLWLKATMANGSQTGWVCLDLIRLKIDGETLATDDLFNPLMADYMNEPVRIIGETVTENGIETTIQHGGDLPFSLVLNGLGVIPYARQEISD